MVSILDSLPAEHSGDHAELVAHRLGFAVR
jgi:hypothetical protein